MHTMMSFPSSPSPGSADLHGDSTGHEARSEVESIPIGLAVDFADEIEFDMGLQPGQSDGQIPGDSFLSSSSSSGCPASPSLSAATHFSINSPSTSTHPIGSSCPISPSSQITDFSMALSPTQTYMTTPPASPLPQPSSSNDSEPGPSWKGKGRAIPTPARHLGSAASSGTGMDPRTTFQTPPDTSFGTPGAVGSGSRGRAMKSREEREREDLPSIMPLSPSPSPSPTPRPSRVRAISGLSFTSLKETIRSKSRSGTASPLSRSVSGAPSPSEERGPKRKLSLKGLANAFVKRKNKSRPGSGLSSEVVSPATSAFQTPSSSLPRRGAGPLARPSIVGVQWESEGISKAQEVLTRPVRGRAETAPVVVGDYSGFRFDVEREDEPSREDASDVLQMIRTPVEEKPPVPLNPFDTLPRELHLLVLNHLVESYISDYHRGLRDGKWSASQAGSEQGKWHGEAAGLRAIIGTARVSRTWHALAHDGTFWTRITYTTLVPPRIAVPSITTWLPSTLRHEAKAPVTIEQLDSQDERVMRLVKTAGPCLTELDMRGGVRFGAGDVKRLLGWITTAAATSAATMRAAVGPSGSPVRSLLSLTRFDTLPPPPTRTTNLTKLVLTSCVKLPTQALNALLSASPNLTRLEMRALPAVTDETCAILATRCRSLTWLDIGRCSNLGAGALPSLCGTNSDGGLKHLRVLHMSGYPHVDTSIFSQLGESLGNTLETLDLAGVWGVTDACLAAYVDIEPSAAQVEMARLAEVERWARTARDSQDRLDIVPPAPFVTLTAREAGLDPTLRGPFYRRRTALRHLNLSGCRRVSDSGLGTLAHGVPNLEVLELGGIGAIMSSPGLVRLFHTTRKIRKVDLEDANITDAVLEALTPPMSDSDDPDDASSIASSESIQIAMRTDPVHPGHALTHLVVSHCTQITSGALAQVVKCCPRLSVLSVDGTPVDDRVVRFFVCAARARGLTGAEVGATDTRFVARAGLPTTGIRSRKGTREWVTRGLGYVDARDPNTTTTEAEDECDESKVVVKTYWSWQGVDGLLERRRATLGRRNTDGGSGVVGPSGLRGGPRWGRHRHDERGGCVVM